MSENHPFRRIAVGIAALAVACASVLVAPAAQAAQAAQTTPAAPAATGPKAGDLVQVALKDLHPTQPNLGHDQVYYKLGRYAGTKDTDRGKVNKRFDDWCETNGQQQARKAGKNATLRDPSSFTCTVAVGKETSDTIAAMKTVVVGPGGTLYLTDGHHTMTSFLQTPDGGASMRIRVRVVANLSTDTKDQFWQTMRDRSWVWLQTADGTAIQPSQLPSSLGLSTMPDDPYRGLVYFTRDVGYSVPDSSAEFLEFYWAGWLRSRVDITRYDRNDLTSYRDAVGVASHLMSDTPGNTEIAPGHTADQLGRMADWNDGADADDGTFGDLAVPIGDDKPGKLAYAISARPKN